ncbi:MAG: response regulator [Gemmatimonadota bacterium]
MKQILVIDDSQDERQIMRALLEHDGYQVATASDSATALAELRARPPHAILMGLRLPDVPGLELARMIRDEPGMADVPLVAVSAFLDRFDESQLRQAGFDTWISKPIGAGNIRQLLSAMWRDEKRLDS